MLFIVIFEKDQFFSNHLIYGPFITRQEANNWAKGKENLTTRKWSIARIDKP